MTLRDPWVEAKYEVMMEGCVGKECGRRWKVWEGIERGGVCGSLTEVSLLSDRGICRRHTDQPTAYFYDPQFSYTSIPQSSPSSFASKASGDVGGMQWFIPLCICVCHGCEVMTLSHRLHLPWCKIAFATYWNPWLSIMVQTFTHSNKSNKIYVCNSDHFILLVT